MESRTFAASGKKGVSPEVFLVLVVVSSAELTDLKPKGFSKFSVNRASWSLFGVLGQVVRLFIKQKKNRWNFA